MFAAAVNFAAVLLSLVSGAIASSANLVERQSTAYVVNGDFSEPLLGTWEVIPEGAVNDGIVTRTKNHRNTVVPFSVPGDCSVDSVPSYELPGTIANVKPGYRYRVSWDYLFSEHWQYAFWRFSAQPTGGHGLRGLDYTRTVKKNEWYTFTGGFKIKADRPKVLNPTNVTLIIGYWKCSSVGPNGFSGDVPIDNVRVRESSPV
ncbi:uncharacterized protein LTR77_011083 [Saxophila tyrrhenica]|uniref:CBM-cenC domain-containing protein n=1 Tax=Saxophila tyrrhenica TaxID=1690608 RepID=A0AAV9NTZ3_9PEZI|nr:hypothetical protein LTR77_011083 [Saxophila tyrrhenica]